MDDTSSVPEQSFSAATKSTDSHEKRQQLWDTGRDFLAAAAPAACGSPCARGGADDAGDSVGNSCGLPCARVTFGKDMYCVVGLREFYRVCELT